MTFTATLSSTGGTPTGTVTFERGTATLAKVTAVNGIATYTTKPTQLAVGTSSITAVYAGDAKHAGSTSPVLSQVVNKAATTTVLASQPNPSTKGQSVALTATVTAGSTVPTGSVTFMNGSKVLGRASLSNGIATLNAVFSKAGTFSLTANYTGNGNYQSSSGGVTQTVQ